MLDVFPKYLKLKLSEITGHQSASGSISTKPIGILSNKRKCYIVFQNSLLLQATEFILVILPKSTQKKSARKL